MNAIRSDARAILDSAARAADPYAVVSRRISVRDDELFFDDEWLGRLPAGGRVFVVGAGKATPRMAEAVLELLGDRVAGGSVTTKDGHGVPLPGLDLWEAGHPIPDVRSMAGASEALRVARAAGDGELLLCLLSGGASALWAGPPRGVSLSDLQEVTGALLRGGAPIGELNTVRKHLSIIAGGRLLQAAAPARVVTLAISDVIAVSPDTIGSGPTLPDPTTYREAIEILRRRGVTPPAGVADHLRAGAAGERPETLKPAESGAGEFRVLASVRDALGAAAAAAERLGYRARIVTATLEGEAREVGADIAREAVAAARSAEQPLALLWGGETTVTVRGGGRGGRNQELAVAAAREIAGEPRLVLAAFGTDGTDGPTDAAGGIVDGQTLSRASSRGLHPDPVLAANDSYHFLRAAGDLLVTGPTGTNVNDVVLALVK